MRNDGSNVNSTEKWLFGMVYAICGISVLMTGLYVWSHCIRENYSTKDEHLLSLEELQKNQRKAEIPNEWKFLLEDSKKHHSPREFEIPNLNNELISEGIAAVAANLEARRVAFENRPLPPIFRLQKMRQEAPRTYENTPEEVAEWIQSPIEKRTAGNLEPVLESVARSSASGVHQSGKPASLADENEKTSEELVLQEIETLTQTIPSEPHLIIEEENFDFPNETLDVSFDVSNQPSQPKILMPPPQNRGVSTPLEAPRLDEEVRYKPGIPEEKSSAAADSSNGTEPTGNREKTDPAAKWGIPPSSPPSSNLSGSYDPNEGLRILHFFNQLAKNRLETYSNEIHDYDCILYKWDPTNNTIDGGDVMFLKLRENPYSIYARFEYPKRYSGREWIFWEGHYKDRLIVNSGPNAWRRTLSLEPDSAGVKNCASRPILQLGFRRLLEELISISENEDDFQTAQIQYYADAKVGTRPCYALEVTFTEKSDKNQNDFYRIQIYVDRELILPIQLIIYDWPEEGKEPKMRESYTYVILKMNPGLRDEDFCHLNPEYDFRHYIPRIPEDELKFMEQFFPPAQ